MPSPTIKAKDLKLGYDVQCYNLAKHFLVDTPEINTHANCDSLARDLQEAAENWFADKEAGRR